MRIEGHSHIGLNRQIQVDAMGWDERQGIAVVADGHIGGIAPEKAAQLTVYAVLEAARQENPDGGLYMSHGGEPRLLLELANHALLAHQQRHREYRGMRASAALICVGEQRIATAHTGNCRIYRMHKGRLNALTRDHTLLQRQLDHELVSEDDARRHPERNYATANLGEDETVQIAINEVDRERGDVYLLCTDGLSNVLSLSELEAILNDYSTAPDAAVRSMIRDATQKSGRDSVTAVILRP